MTDFKHGVWYPADANQLFNLIRRFEERSGFRPEAISCSPYQRIHIIKMFAQYWHDKKLKEKELEELKKSKDVKIFGIPLISNNKIYALPNPPEDLWPPIHSLNC